MQYTYYGFTSELVIVIKVKRSSFTPTLEVGSLSLSLSLTLSLYTNTWGWFSLSLYTNKGCIDILIPLAINPKSFT